MRRPRLLRRATAAALAAALVLGGAVAASADDIDDRRAAAEKKQRDTMARQDQLQADLAETDSQLAQAVLDLQEVQARLPVAEAELAAAQAEVERTQREAEQLAQRLADAQAEETSITDQLRDGAGKVETARAGIAEMARQAYRGTGEGSSLGIVTGAQSTEQLVQSFAVSSSAARSQARTLADLQQQESVARNREARLTAIRETIADLKRQADENVAAAEAARTAASDRKQEVESLIAQQESLNATIEARKADTQAALDQTDQLRVQTESELKGIIAEQSERDRKAAEEEARRQQEQQAQGGASGGSGGGSTGGGSSSSGGSSSGGGGSSGGFLSYATTNHTVTSNYGMRFHPVYHEWRLHAGTDFRAPCGSPIYSSADGTVVFSRTQGNGNKQVVVNHGTVKGVNLMTSYNHLSSWVVSPGTRVGRGQLVGYSGNTGVGTGCHLHLEVYVNGSTVNPLSWL